MRRYELSDTQWDQIEDLFSSSPHSRGRPRREDRLLLHAIFWILCSGAAWRDLPGNTHVKWSWRDPQKLSHFLCEYFLTPTEMLTIGDHANSIGVFS